MILNPSSIPTASPSIESLAGGHSGGLSGRCVAVQAQGRPKPLWQKLCLTAWMSAIALFGDVSEAELNVFDSSSLFSMQGSQSFWQILLRLESRQPVWAQRKHSFTPQNIRKRHCIWCFLDKSIPNGECGLKIPWWTCFKGDSHLWV